MGRGVGDVEEEGLFAIGFLDVPDRVVADGVGDVVVRGKLADLDGPSVSHQAGWSEEAGGAIDDSVETVKAAVRR